MMKGWSRKGAKDSRFKLSWSKYYKYVFENKDYYFKEKAYTNYCDGIIKIESIKKETYRNAIKRKKNCYEIIVEKDILSADSEALAIILDEKYQISKGDLIGPVKKVKNFIKEIKENSIINADDEYRIFMKKLKEELQLRSE
ncbi:MAG: hypothetical protein TIS_00117 [Tissierella sp.]